MNYEMDKRNAKFNLGQQKIRLGSSSSSYLKKKPI